MGRAPLLLFRCPLYATSSSQLSIPASANRIFELAGGGQHFVFFLFHSPALLLQGFANAIIFARCTAAGRAAIRCVSTITIVGLVFAAYVAVLLLLCALVSVRRGLMISPPPPVLGSPQRHRYCQSAFHLSALIII